MQRNGDRDRGIVALEFHPAGHQQIVQFIHMQRLPRFSKQQSTSLSYGPITETMTDRLNIGADRRNAATLIKVSNRAARSIGSLQTLSRLFPRRPPVFTALLIIVLDPQRFTEIETVSRPHRDKEAVHGLFRLRGAVFESFNFLP